MDQDDFDGDRPTQILVCTYGADCGAALKARDGSPHDLADALKAARNEAGLKRRISVTKTGCMGWCAHAPVVQVLPRGMVLSGLPTSGATETVQACLADPETAPWSARVVWDYGVSRQENEKRRPRPA